MYDLKGKGGVDDNESPEEEYLENEKNEMEGLEVQKVTEE